MTAGWDYSVYLVTDRGLCGKRGLTDVVEAAVRGGTTIVQLREKHASTREFVELARSLKQRLQGTDVPLVVNDRVDVALAAKVDGVHVGQSDMDWRTARRLIGPDAILGLTIDTMDQLLEAENFDVDYLGVGPVYPTPTKTDTCTPWGLDGLAKARASSRHPLVAIGAVDHSNAAEIMSLGMDGVAVVSAICAADDPEAAARALREKVLQGRR